MQYYLYGYQSGEANGGADAECSADTLKDAKAQAKYMLTDAYRRASEASECIKYVQVWRGTDIVYDIFHS